MMLKFAVADVLGTMLVPETANRAARRKMAHRHSFDYTPRPGFLYVRSRAISSRCNDNFDEFPAEEIKKAYKTFVGKPVFVNHHNDDHRRARGVIIDAALHEDRLPDGKPDTWVEVLMEVDAKTFPRLAKAVLNGDIDRTSMGTDVEYSLCSVCGNKATTPAEYCQHIPKMKGQRVYRTEASTGKKVGILVREICYGLRFFENSLLVEEPADPTAVAFGVDDRGLQMAASKMASEPDPKRAHDLREGFIEHGRAVMRNATMFGHEPYLDKMPGSSMLVFRCKHHPETGSSTVHRDHETGDFVTMGNIHDEPCEFNPQSPTYQDQQGDYLNERTKHEKYYREFKMTDSRPIRLDEGPKRSLNSKTASTDASDSEADQDPGFLPLYPRSTSPSLRPKRDPKPDHLEEMHGLPSGPGSDRGDILMRHWMTHHDPTLDQMPRDSDTPGDLHGFVDFLGKISDAYHRHLHGGDLSNDVGHSHPLASDYAEPEIWGPSRYKELEGGVSDPEDPNSQHVFKPPYGCTRTYPYVKETPPKFEGDYDGPERAEYVKKHTCPDCGAYKFLHKLPYEFDTDRLKYSDEFKPDLKQSLNVLSYFRRIANGPFGGLEWAEGQGVPWNDRNGQPHIDDDPVHGILHPDVCPGCRMKWPRQSGKVCPTCRDEIIGSTGGTYDHLRQGHEQSKPLMERTVPWGEEDNHAWREHSVSAPERDDSPHWIRWYENYDAITGRAPSKHPHMDDVYRQSLSALDFFREGMGTVIGSLFQHFAHGDHTTPDVGPLHESDPDYQTLHVHHEDGRTSIPGLGCPHCDGGFFSEKAREDHIRENHPGEYAGPSEDMVLIQEIIKQRQREQEAAEGGYAGAEPHIKSGDTKALFHHMLNHDGHSSGMYDADSAGYDDEDVYDRRRVEEVHNAAHEVMEEENPNGRHGEGEWGYHFHLPEGDGVDYHQHYDIYRDGRSPLTKVPDEHRGPSDPGLLRTHMIRAHGMDPGDVHRAIEPEWEHYAHHSSQENWPEEHHWPHPHSHDPKTGSLCEHAQVPILPGTKQSRMAKGQCPDCHQVVTGKISGPGLVTLAKHAAGPRRFFAEHPSGYRAEYNGGGRFHVYDADGTPVDSPGFPWYTMAESSEELEQKSKRVNNSTLKRHLDRWVKQNGEATTRFNHPEDEPMSYADRQRFKDLDRRAKHAAREYEPDGVSPQEEWHGPYEVVQHPQTGRYHVVDNQGRRALIGGQGFSTEEQAGRSRDAIDQMRSSYEKGRGLADRLFNGAMDIFDPGGTDESRRSEQNMESANHLLMRYEPHHIKYDSDDKPYAEARHPSGWSARDYGGNSVHIYHDATGDEYSHDLIDVPGGARGDFFTPGGKPVGYDHAALTKELHSWVHDHGDEYAQHDRKIQRWNQRRGY